MPTLPRYPVAETKNTSCWSEPPAERFQVRGASYLTSSTSSRKKCKVPSGPYLFSARGADVFLTNRSSGPVKKLASNYSTILGGHARSLPTFIINFVCPWGLITNYYEMPDIYLRYLKSNEASRAGDEASLIELKPHERAMARFLMGDDSYRDSTLKLIPHAVEGPLVVRKMVKGTPAIIGKRLPTKYTYLPAEPQRGLADCFEVDLDVNETDKVGKTACNMGKRYMSSVSVDLGFVIEAQREDELPERMFGCVRLHRIDALSSPTLPPVEAEAA